MKAGRPSDFIRSFKLGGMTINVKNFWGKPMAFVLLAFVIGATVSQGSFAFADDSATNPFRAIWDAIGELQIKTDSLQAQIDDLKAQRGTVVSAAQTVTKNSEASLGIDVTAGQSGQTLVTFIVRNAGPDSAVGVKLTAFYQTSLFQINFIQGAECSDGSRGIVECYLGTIVAGSETRIVADATPISLGQQAIITADLSSITDDTNLANNHAESVFTTSVAPVVSPPVTPTAPVLQPQPETIQLDKPEYAAGETVTVTGNVGSVNTVQQMQIQVSFTDGTPYSSEQIAVAPDGSYQYQFSIPADTSDLGMYRVLASYDGRTIEVLFNVVAAQAPEPPAEEQPTEEQPAEEPPAEEPPAEEQPTEEQPAEEPPAEEPPADDSGSDQGSTGGGTGSNSTSTG
ncbi:hypothetical protein [Nitrososphaera sp.]|uniref:hypothetical protein n=1 Tax=Nitrososphaera sp. TaxID=1971748 RepID=UPI003171F519